MEKFSQKKNRNHGKGHSIFINTEGNRVMKEKLSDCMFLIEDAKTAMRQLGIEPIVVPIRGGTDGARLSYEGIPCPNLCTGGENYHGRFEYIPADDMRTIVRLLATMMWNIAEK